MGKAMLCMAASTMLFGCLLERDMEVRVFELERLDPDEVVSLIEPYVYPDREGSQGYVSVTDNTLTVRELPENLDRIAAVLERFDTPRSTVLLKFQIVAANGYEGSDPEIATVEVELRKLLRYKGYKLLANTIVRVLEGENATQMVIVNENPLEIRVGIGPVRGEAVELEVQVSAPRTQVLATVVNLQFGRTVVLGTGRNTRLVNGQFRDDGALILVVTAEIS